MKYGIDMGHNCSNDKGASGVRIEDELNKEVGLLVIEKLKSLGNEVVNCTPQNASSLSDSLRQRCEKANVNHVDIFVSIHFNAGGGRGTEVYAMSQKGREIASRVLQSITSLGFINRGVKDGSWLYVLRNSAATAILIECAFVDSKEDIDLYDKEKMSNAIVKGLTGVIPSEPSVPLEPPKPVSNDTSKLQMALNRLKVRDSNGNILIEDGIYGAKTKSAVIRFQNVFGLKVDGIAGPDTWNVINTILNKPLLGIRYKNIIGTKYLQWRLGINIDGIFGNITKAAVMKYQRDNAIVADGIVGPITWSKLIG